MNKAYLYMHHSASVFYLQDHELTAEELNCPACDDSDTLIGIYDDEASMAAQLLKLFEAGYDLAPCEEYLDIKDRYCPPELRLWELGQFEEDSPECRAYAQRLKTAENTYWKKGIDENSAL